MGKEKLFDESGPVVRRDTGSRIAGIGGRRCKARADLVVVVGGFGGKRNGFATREGCARGREAP